MQSLVEEINRKKYRAPLNDVQCAPERDACLQCYRDKQSDILKCKEVADAFIRCSQQTTEVRLFVQRCVVVTAFAIALTRVFSHTLACVC